MRTNILAVLFPSKGDESLSKELDDLEIEEKELIVKLEEVEDERKKVSEALEKEKQISKELDKAEKAYHIEYCELQRELLDFEDEQQRYFITVFIYSLKYQPIVTICCYFAE